MLSPALDMFIQRMPKVELHVHLEGAISPHTALDLARQNGIIIPANDIATIENLFNYRTFGDFLSVFMSLTRTIVKFDDFERLAYEMGLAFAAQHVLYAEVMISPMQHLLRSVNLMHAIYSTAAGFSRVEEETGVKVRLAFDYGRQYGPEYAWCVLDIAKQAQNFGVVAWSIGGNEIYHPPEPFAEVFAAARETGLHLMAHAGEVVGPESVWGAVKALKVERIGHGIRSISDPALVEYLRDHRIVLDISPSSNIYTGAVESWEEHPIRKLYDAGVLITINSDDPPFFHTTLTDEYRHIVNRFGFTVDDLCVLTRNSVEASFLPPDEKQHLRERVDCELAAIRAELHV